MKLSRLLLVALLLTGAAIVLAVLAGPSRDAHLNYLKLCTWDCGWYESIVKTGYHSVIPPVRQDARYANVAFFPAYPMFARALYLLFGLLFGMSDARPPLLVVAHFFCVAFWLSFLLILDRWRIDRGIQALVLLAVFAHPAGFFLITGYSESLFMASMLFFFYWADDENPRRRWLAIVPGFLMTATRIVGLPVAAYPVLRWMMKQKRGEIQWRGVLQPGLIAAASSLGCLLFFAYCQLRFGDYKLYMETQRIGWGIIPDYGTLWKWGEFNYIAPYEQVATIAAALSLALYWLAELFRSVVKRTRPDAFRVPLMTCATLVFYITICGLKSLWFRSMIRYTLPIWLLLVLCVLQWVTQQAPLAQEGVPANRLPARLAVAFGIGALIVFYGLYEFPYLADFLNSRWFA